jgi:hypothetical protein
MPSRRARGRSVTSTDCRDTVKPCSLQIARRAAARPPAKAGRRLWRRALAEAWPRAWPSRRDAGGATPGNGPGGQGAARAMALSDHRRRASAPRWPRTSRTVTPSRRRRTGQRTTRGGSRAGSARGRACGPKRRQGARGGTRRRAGTTGRPACRRTAVPGQIPAMRSPSPRQPGTAARRHRVVSPASTSAGAGRQARHGGCPSAGTPRPGRSPAPPPQTRNGQSRAERLTSALLGRLTRQVHDTASPCAPRWRCSPAATAELL